MYRVGGDIEIDVSLLLSNKKRNQEALTKEYPNHLWTGTGRAAILLALEELEIRGVERIAYLPAYICDSVVQPFKEKNYTIYFYSMGADLNTPENLPRKLNNVVFLFVHYFGLENKAIKKWLENERSTQQFFVIEDCVQAAFSEFDNELFDFKIYSYRKFTPQPDGALLISREKLHFNFEKLCTQDEKYFLLAQVEGKIRRSLSKDDSEFLSLLKSSESRLDSRMSVGRMSEFSVFLMERIDIEQIKKKRKENWLFFSNMVESDSLIKKFLTPLYTTILDNEVPLGFPVLAPVELRNSLRQYLINHNIFCPIHWIIPEKNFVNDMRISSAILTIPIDQRISEEHILYVVEKLHQFFLEVIK
ncbi:hypothetical protein KDC22_30485 [Paenibacillus tritici]|uniref:hypothetical protein n=1 Tax=Paenibacillus tritici TaxID=1873425 RepID=UPI001BAAC147|nr:hypothetical protein [Paenibacillus tritici]QUL54549.1 hypothetical protein KDC22_30485 [Paenibacillus tritici]